MSIAIQVVDRLKASTGNDQIGSDSLLGYTNPPALSALTGSQLVTKDMAQSIASGVPTIQIPVIPAGQSIPFFVDITLYTGITVTSEVITKATSYDPATGAPTGKLQRWYDMVIEDEDTVGDGSGTFTGWNIYGHDDGSGNFKEDTTVILKG